MKRGRSTCNPTKAERLWLQTVKGLGCICCIDRGYKLVGEDGEKPVVEAHHLLSGGIRIGHSATVGLCQWHHRGQLIVYGWTHHTHRRMLGPSLAEGSVPFREAFGDDAELMRKQHQLIALNNARAA